MKAVYIRTSTEEQTPELQIRDIETISGKDYQLFQDKQSAWKDNVDRDDFERLRKDIKDKKIKELYVWDLDRLFRNRKKLIEFFTFCKIYGCKIHSFNQQWLESLNSIQEPFNEIMHSLMLQIMGWLAEDESSRKSGRVKNAVRRKEGEPTRSYKGNRWGYHAVGKNTDSQIIELHKQGKSIRDIAKEVFYWNKSNNKKLVSVGYVHKVLSNFKVNNNSNEVIQELPN
jgi:DNA invertase Pin-like site-specific DNA recombinase